MKTTYFQWITLLLQYCIQLSGFHFYQLLGISKFLQISQARVGDISELSLVPSISMYSKILYFLCVLVLCTQVNMMFVMLLWVCIHTGQAEKFV
jgi:ABC-type branched-subunit amino acid transport system permease subunit